jgi:hypothetical protein
MKADKIKLIAAIGTLVLSVLWLIKGGAYEATITFLGAVSTISSATAVVSLIGFKKISNQNIKRIKKLFEWFLIGVAFICISYAFVRLAICHELKLRIENIKNKTAVEGLVDIKGGSCKLASNQVIWVIVYSYSDSKFYPHPLSAEIDYGNGDWSNLKTVVGASYEKNEKFDIYSIVFESNSPTHDTIRKYLALPERHGLQDLPPYKTRDKITVFRK